MKSISVGFLNLNIADFNRIRSVKFENINEEGIKNTSKTISVIADKRNIEQAYSSFLIYSVSIYSFSQISVKLYWDQKR